MNFDWTINSGHILTAIGFAVTVGLGVTGFGRWKRQQLESRKIETAIEALAISYESKYVFESIRSPMAYQYEWDDMPVLANESEAQRRRRAPFYAIGKRIRTNGEFFERVFKLQPRCMAVFGKEAEDIFTLLHEARRSIEVACEMLGWRVLDGDRGEDAETKKLYAQLKRDAWEMKNYQPEKDEVGKKLREFRDRMEALCRPVIGSDFKGIAQKVELVG